MSKQLAVASGAALPWPVVIVGEYQLNRHECFRVTLCERGGKRTLALSRWKRTASVERRTSPPLEFGIHRAAAIVTMLTEALSSVETRREER